MNLLRYSLLAVVAVMMIASCGYPDHLETLPKETVAVVGFDLAGMAAKGDLHKIQEAEFYKKMQEKMNEKDAEAAKETDEFLKNPLNYGINFLEPVYLFVIQQDSAPAVGFSVALGDAGKFKTFVTKIAGDGATIEAGTGYSRLTTAEGDFAWNDFALIVLPKVGATDNSTLLASIFAKKEKEQSVVGQPGFKSYYKNSKDISGWVGLGFLKSLTDVAKLLSPSSVKDGEMAELQKQLEQLKDASFQFHVTFKKDEIYTEYITDLPKELKKTYADQEILRDGSPGKISGLITGKELGVIALSLNLQNYLKTLTNNPAITGETKESIASYVAIAQQFIAPFDGDLLIAVTDVREIERIVTQQVPVEDTNNGLAASTEKDLEDWDWDMEYRDTTYTKKETLPVFLAATTLNDESFGFLGMMLGKEKPTSGKVKATDLGGWEIYTTIKDKVLVISNDKAAVEAINAGTFKGNGSSLMAKGASDHGMYFFANLDLSKYPQIVRDAVTTGVNNPETQAVVQFVGMLDHVEAYDTEDFSAVVTFKLKSKGQNSLYTIIESAGNTAYQLGAFN